MKIRPKDRASWQRWFAWHPVIIDNVTVWLQFVERRRHPDIFDWVYGYRLIDRDDRGKRPRFLNGLRKALHHRRDGLRKRFLR